MLIEKSCKLHENSKLHVLLKRKILHYCTIRKFSLFISPQIFHEFFISIDDKNRYCNKNYTYYIVKKYKNYKYIFFDCLESKCDARIIFRNYNHI